ncbi:MAG TPA: MarR family winged helix-turn-helix transcriptional regulator [Ramlibacter sp.]|nr:MarR family winged helix-turn-helix transcriptional regulator [Ramlibacter sp.]
MVARRKQEVRPDGAVQVLRKLRLVFHTVRGHFHEVERKAGVSGAQVWALGVVRDRPGIRLGELATALDIRQSTASNLIKPLVAKGMLEVTRPECDRRIVELRVTPLARTVLRKAPLPVTGVLPHALGKLPVDQLARLDRNLDQLLAVLETDQRDARIPLGDASETHDLRARG